MTIDANGSSGVFEVNATDVIISGLTLTGATGSGVFSYGDLTLQSCKVTGNHFGVGSDSSLAIDDCQITGNSGDAVRVGTGWKLEITGSTISNNSGRGVVSTAGQVTITDSTISGNTAPKGAAVILGATPGYDGNPGYGGSATITNTVISGNTTTEGGAVYVEAGDLTLIDSTVSGNLGDAPAIGMRDARLPHAGNVSVRLTLDNSDVIDNAVSGIVMHGARRLTVAESNISGNGAWGAYFGGYAELSTSEVLITNSRFNNNAQGLLLNGLGDSSTAVIQGNEISSNTTGGGLTLLGLIHAEIVESTISGNHNSESGGGILAQYIYANASLSIKRSTISGNTSNGDGGGIFFASDFLTIEESTISGNSANGSGGGLWQYAFGTPSLIARSTIANNSAGIAAGGVYVSTQYDEGGAEITGCIISNNTATTEPDLVALAHTTVNYSLIENPGTTTISGTGNIVGVDAVLGPLRDNGGPTFTHALLAGSPAIDGGDPTAEPRVDGVPLYDQRGASFERVRDGDAPEDIAIDMGAFEVQAFVLPAAGDFDGDGDVDGRDFLAWQRGESPNSLGTDDLVIWQLAYGPEEVSAVSSELLARDEAAGLEGGER